MARVRPPIYRGFEASCIHSNRTRVFYAHVINVRSVLIPFRFRKAGDVDRALRAAVDAYLADCRFSGRKPEKPVPAGAKERATQRRIDALLRASQRPANSRRPRPA